VTQGFSLAIDAMGGDNAPEIVLDGLELAAERHPEARFLLVGDEARLSGMLALRKRAARLCSLRHAPDVIPSEMKPTTALRQGGTAPCGWRSTPWPRAKPPAWSRPATPAR
jgi:glycerol-3-phosphate acyltransferase PlsX